jgi:cobalt ECF transporter T component CbiQ
MSFLERTIEGLHEAIERALEAEHSAARRGLLQQIDARIKVLGLFALIVAATMSTRLWPIAALLALAIVLTALSRISIRTLMSRVWIGALLFTGAIAIPALFLTPGATIGSLPITRQGVTTAGFLILRVETAATLAILLVFTTPWAHVLKALRVFRVPVVFVAVLGMTCRYILLLLEIAHDMFESRRSRTVGTLRGRERRHMAVASAGVLLNRSSQLSGDVYLAMQSRGFRGEVYVLDDFRMTPRDWAALAAFAALVAVAVWAGR